MMKRLFALLALSLSLSLHAEDLSMLSDNSKWVYGRYFNNGNISEWTLTHKIKGSFEANGKTYYKLYQVDYEMVEMGYTKVVEFTDNPVGIREDNGKVYVYKQDYENVTNSLKRHGLIKTDVTPYLLTEDGELLLYDFTLNEGDQYPTSSDYGTLIVSSVEIARTFDGAERKLFTLSNGLKILEGVGCLNTDDVIFYLHDHYTMAEYTGLGDIFYYALFEYLKDGETVNYIDENTDLPYLTLVEDDKSWQGLEFDEMSGKSYECNYFLKGDTVIGGETYKKCYAVMSRLGSDIPRYECALQEHDHKVWAVYSGQTRKFLLFDFTLQIGDTFPLTEYGEDCDITMQLVSTDLVWSGVGGVLRRYNFQKLTGDSKVYSYIEGVGKTGDAYPFAWQIDHIGGMQYFLTGCYLSDILLYPERTNTGIIPVKPHSANPHIYDLQGRRLTTEPKRGAYIKGGKLRVKSGM